MAEDRISTGSQRYRRSLRAVALAAVFGLTLAGCTESFRDHGFVPPQDELDAITLGQDTRDTLAQTLGQPAGAGVIGETTWFYSQYRVRSYAWRAPEIVTREIVAVSFADNGTVSNVETFTLADGQVVDISRRVTESSIREVSIFRQVLGNFGRINIGELVNAGN
ncbi:outer membrane protein assembly factor BamE [Rhodobacteraceae bacterium XHP0102]|nr:outer membrane protein assembly factor BamE [Rhodobacteraceae bacterium XHP0102]